MAQPIVVERARTDTALWRPAAAYAVLLAAFIVLGLTTGAQGVLWAELISALGVGMGTFGTAQLLSPLVSVALLLYGGQIAAAAGKKRLAVASLAFLAGSSLALAAGGNLWELIGALVVLGAGNGLFEVAMNGATLDWETATGRGARNLMHAGYSAGAMAGAFGTGWRLRLSWTPSQVFVLVAIVGAAVALAALATRFPPVEVDPDERREPGATVRFILGRRGLVVPALVCVLAAVGESVANVSTCASGGRGPSSAARPSPS